MTDEERRAWLRTLALLALVAAARWGWAHRPGGEIPPGSGRDIAAAIDTVRELRAEADRRSRPLSLGETVDPNRADAVELDRLPGIGPVTAEAIVSARTEAPFEGVDDLLAVRGIGPATLEKIKPYLRIGVRAGLPTGSGTGPPGPVAEPTGADPIDVNRALAAELEALPGIGPALAGRIVRDRSETGRYRSVDDLLRVPGIGPVTLARIRGLVRVR